MEYYHSIYELKKSEEIKYYEESEIDFESSEDQQYKFFSLKDVNLYFNRQKLLSNR